MLLPKKVKHRKWQKGRKLNRGKATRGNEISFGSFALKSTGHAWINARQIEAARRAMTRYTKRGGKIWIRIFPDKPVTTKGSEVPMGKGKGTPEYFIAQVKPGTVLFEMEGVQADQAQEAMRLAGAKLPVKTKFVSK